MKLFFFLIIIIIHTLQWVIWRVLLHVPYLSHSTILLFLSLVKTIHKKECQLDNWTTVIKETKKKIYLFTTATTPSQPVLKLPKVQFKINISNVVTTQTILCLSKDDSCWQAAWYKGLTRQSNIHVLMVIQVHSFLRGEGSFTQDSFHFRSSKVTVLNACQMDKISAG